MFFEDNPFIPPRGVLDDRFGFALLGGIDTPN
jgi:hypothetical protein